MKRNHIQFTFVPAFLAILLATGCSKKFEDYSQNKNLPQSVPPGLVLRSTLNSLVVFPGGFEDKADQNIASNYTYYGDNKYWTGSATLNYSQLANVLAMEAEARMAVGSDNNPYHALGFFLRALFFVNMSVKVGDLPMSEALLGTKNPAPKYDTQKDIFRQSLAWLDSANTMLAGFINNGFLEFSGDWYYQETSTYADATGRNALIEWQKVVNSFKLRVLIELSKRADDAADLNIKQQFADIVSDPVKYPIFTSNADNLQYVYNNTYNYYPDNPGNYGNNADRLNLGSTLETTLGQLRDIRAMIFGEPARGLGHSDTSYESFAGGPLGADLSLLATLNGAKQISVYNYNHFYSTYTAEPTLILSYGEVCFSIAEGINRGWVTGDAAAWYANGIKAMFGFYGIKDGDNTVVFRNAAGTANLNYTVAFPYAGYLNQDAIKYKGDNADGLQQILIQKYLGYARNSGLQAYYQWRRTGIPAFSAGSGTGNGNRIPLRFQYPTNEVTTNGDNLQSALQSQFGGADDINAKMWLIK
jgi:hypothetical protein